MREELESNTYEHNKREWKDKKEVKYTLRGRSSKSEEPQQKGFSVPSKEWHNVMWQQWETKAIWNLMGMFVITGLVNAT